MVSLNPLALAVPVFGLAVVAEARLARHRGRDAGYHFGTAVSDVSCGATYQVLEVVLRVATVGVYAFVFEHARLLSWEAGSLWPWLIGAIGIDLAYYGWHRVSHVVNAMWAVHAVHHQSEDYNFAVALRQPLLEPLTWTPFFCVLALVGIPAEVALACFAANMFYQFWLHTELVHRLPRPLEWVLNTPSHHRVHHGIEPEYLDKNYGGVLIIWDRLFGSFEPERRAPTYGTTHPLRSFNPLWGNVEHWYRIVVLARRARGLRERLYAIVAHPAWRPVGVDEDVPATRGDKYRPSVSHAALRHSVTALAVISLGVGALMLVEPMLTRTEQALAFAVVVVAFVAVTARLERRRWADRLDTVRICSTVGLTVVLLARHVGPTAAMLGAALAIALATLPRWRSTAT